LIGNHRPPSPQGRNNDYSSKIARETSGAKRPQAEKLIPKLPDETRAESEKKKRLVSQGAPLFAKKRGDALSKRSLVGREGSPSWGEKGYKKPDSPGEKREKKQGRRSKGENV